MTSGAGTAGGGTLSISSGASTVGAGGVVEISTPTSSTGDTGSICFTSGTAESGNSGNVTICAGGSEVGAAGANGALSDAFKEFVANDNGLGTATAAYSLSGDAADDQ